jgi:hypothetical protein
MERLLMWHKVADFDTWKAAYDADAPARAEMGFGEGKIHRFMLDPTTFLVEYEGEGLMGKLNGMLNDPAAQGKMKEAGVEKMDFTVVVG